MFEILAFIFLLLVLFYFYRSRNVNYWIKQGVPSAPNCHWFFGHYQSILLGKQTLGNLFQGFYDEFPEEPVVGYIKMALPGLMIRDPDLIKAILSTDFNSFTKNDFKVNKDVDFLLAYNPFSLDGDDWRSSRGHMTPIVTFAKLKNYFPKIATVGDELVKYIERNFDEHQTVQLETKALLGMYTTDVVANVICGIQNNTFEDKDSLFATITREIFQSTFLENLKTMALFVFPEISQIVNFKMASDRTEKIILELTQKMMKERADGDNTANDFFQQMTTFRKNDKDGIFTDKYIASHFYGFIMDGYETSSIAASFTLFELAWNSNVQEKLRSEILEMIARTKGEYTIEDVEGLKYLDMVLNEGLRIHSPAFVLAKECTKDYTLNHSKLNKPLVIKKGTRISIPVSSLHSDDRFYKSPNLFDPERFTEEEVAARHKFVYLPFGEGPRKCIGQRFGVLQTKTSLIKILQHFRVKPSARTNYPVEDDPKVFFLKRALNGAWVTFKKL